MHAFFTAESDTFIYLNTELHIDGWMDGDTQSFLIWASGPPKQNKLWHQEMIGEFKKNPHTFLSCRFHSLNIKLNIKLYTPHRFMEFMMI